VAYKSNTRERGSYAIVSGLFGAKKSAIAGAKHQYPMLSIGSLMAMATVVALLLHYDGQMTVRSSGLDAGRQTAYYNSCQLLQCEGK
jgi:hypothetical protein